MYKFSGITSVLVALIAVILSIEPANSNTNKAVVVTIDGPIGPATSDYFHRSLEKAISHGATLIILKLNTSLDYLKKIY